VSTGVTGLDGNTWFQGGAGAPSVEIAVSITDTGVGVDSASLQLVAEDVVPGTTLDIAPTPGGGGKIHFRLPVSAVQGRAGRLHFSLRAVDQLQHAATSAASDANSIWVDAQQPGLTVSIVPGADAVSGWVPRTGDSIEVRATVDDGAGSGPGSASLAFNPCPASGPCNYQGTVAV